MPVRYESQRCTIRFAVLGEVEVNLSVASYCNPLRATLRRAPVTLLVTRAQGLVKSFLRFVLPGVPRRPPRQGAFLEPNLQGKERVLQARSGQAAVSS